MSTPQLLCDFAMDDDFLLFYLIEGMPEISYISVSYKLNGKPLKVDDLRNTIFEDRCKHFVENHHNLTLLKVRILIVTIYTV